MTDIASNVSNFWRSAAIRGAMFFALWVILTLGDRNDFAVGIFAAIIATWISLFLLPPAPTHPSLLPLLKFMLHFFRQSVIAGLDVAKRAFDPKLPLNPGYVQFSCPISAGPARSAFCALSSLLPGTMPVKSDATGNVLVHCLDTLQPVVEQLSKDASLFRAAAGAVRNDG
ncbi:Na+/H+ antiporter subunit E [Hyphomicrobium denitrificans]|uniref:Na+/H+ antiporter subunit E n=1 Tax=Hyphomicrobium denitrificans TaxID=53399 RepID=UPI0005A505BF|nr:Na+/H+ antiporter subunit E [Hyphomicrobium denitrificans]